MTDSDQDKFVNLVRDLFAEPFARTVNNDLPLEEPIDVQWAGPDRVRFRLRLYLLGDSVLAVNESAHRHEPWAGERRVIIEGPTAVAIARRIGELTGAG